MALCTIDLRDCKGCSLNLIASKRPLTELASRSDLLLCETPCEGALEAIKLRYSVHKTTMPQKEVFR